MSRKKMSSRSKLKPKATAPASSLDDYWVDSGDRAFVPTTDYPMRLRVAPALLPDADGKMWSRNFGWPLTLDESRRLSPAEALRKAEAERTKPTDKKLFAWVLMRCLDAEVVAPDLDTQHRLMRDAYNDLLSAMAVAYTRQWRNSVEYGKSGGRNSVITRTDKANDWKEEVRIAMRRPGNKDLSAPDLAGRIRDTYIDDKTWIEEDAPKKSTIRPFIQKERKAK